MRIQVECGGCGKRYAVEESAAGKSAKCKACGTVIKVPRQATPAAAAPLPLKVPPAPAAVAGAAIPIAKRAPMPAAAAGNPSMVRRTPAASTIDDIPMAKLAPASSSAGGKRSAPPPVPVAENSNDAIDWAAVSQFDASASRSAAAAGCPGCGSPLAAGAVLCTNCGFNIRTGQQAKTEIDLAPAAPPPLPPPRRVGASIPPPPPRPMTTVYNSGGSGIRWGLGGGVATFVLIGLRILLAVIRANTPTSNNSGGSGTTGYGGSSAGAASALVSTPVGPGGPTKPIFPLRMSPRSSSDNVDFYAVRVQGSGPAVPMTLWLYLPTGTHAPQSLPCVLIAPAGTRFIHGSVLAEGDRPEHLPYVHAGFAVIAYELSGDVPPTPGGRVRYGDLRDPVRAFAAADGGLANARVAIDYALARVPEIDPARLYAAGHNSAAVMALNLSMADSRIRAVAAYAPACDVEKRLASELPILERVIPGTTALAARVSPMQHVEAIKCPVLLFHADDDSRVATADNVAYYAALTAAGKTVEFRRVSSGDHYQSMIDQGIKAGIAFFQANGAKAR
jgi:dienelactone hydrolase